MLFSINGQCCYIIYNTLKKGLKMKKLLKSYLLILSVFVLIIGCGKDGSTTTAKNPDTPFIEDIQNNGNSEKQPENNPQILNATIKEPKLDDNDLSIESLSNLPLSRSAFMASISF